MANRINDLIRQGIDLEDLDEIDDLKEWKGSNKFVSKKNIRKVKNDKPRSNTRRSKYDPQNP